MGYWDWIILTAALIALFTIAVCSSKYVHSVSDFLTARRGAGRYLIAVASGEAALGLVYMVSMCESTFDTGYAVSPYWGRITSIIMIFLTLSGYCVFRFRETRAMTMGQFLEMRYNRAFRIYAAVLQSISGVISYAMLPAISARVFIYYLDLPFTIHIGSWQISTFILLMTVILAIALIIIFLGGQISIMLTDSIQGIICYPLYLMIVLFLLINFPFFEDVFPSLANRPPGQSMLNPFDVQKVRVFNLFAIFVGLVAAILNRMSWSSTQGYSVAAKNPHEQKMAGVLSLWRDGFSFMMIIVLSISIYAFFHSAKHTPQARQVSTQLINRVSLDVTGKDYTAATGRTIPEDKSIQDIEREARDAISEISPKQGQTFGSVYNQMRTIFTIKYLLPTGLLGVFCVIMLFLAVSTDTTTIHSWGSIIVQDVIMPLCKKELSPKAHLLALKLSMLLVALIAFIFSSFFSQFDYLAMFFVITGAIWLGGAGPCIVFGLYWKRGTTAGAFCSMIFGSLIAVGGFLLQGTWASTIYPFLERSGLLPVTRKIVEGISAPLEPYIMLRVVPDSFPLNSQEIYFCAMIFSVSLYIAVSLITGRKKVFNMDKLLHRGSYRVEGVELAAKQDWSFRGICRTLIGIDSNYTGGDRALAYSVFLYSIVWGFGSWLFSFIWNIFSPWTIEAWGKWFFLFNYILPIIIGLISTVWFMCCGTRDLCSFFKFLKTSKSDLNENGSVEHDDK